MRVLLRLLVATPLLALIAGTLSVYPHQLAYFNEVAGGPENGHKHLLGSNLDWGQDLFYLREWIAAYPKARPLTVTYMGFFDPAVTGVDFPRTPPVPPDANRPEALDQLQPGWHAVSVTYLRHSSRMYDYLRDFKPIELAGYSIGVFWIGEEDVRELGTRVR